MTTHQPEESPRPWTVEPWDAWTANVLDADGITVAQGFSLSAAARVVRAVNSHEALVTALRGARDIAYRMYGDIEEPGDHWEECPAYDEDSHLYAVHGRDCGSAPGVRIGPWFERADLGCCDPEEERDAAEMLAVCHCHVKELHGLVTMADAALAAATEGR
jgi:hypothetical protein